MFSLSPPPGRALADLETRRRSTVDGCPDCLNYETPRAIDPLPTLARCFIAFYICSDCNHTWSTSWTDN